MRILWHGVPPWWPTGYGVQCKTWAPRLAAAGHEVIISAHAGADNCGDVEWQGIPVLPSTPHPVAQPIVLADRLERVKPDLVFLHCDVRQIAAPELLGKYRTVAWVPDDGDRLSAGNAQFLQRSGAQPWAMSKHAGHILEEAGYDPPYVPHALDTGVWCPPEDRGAVREKMGLQPGQFAVGINARNIDPHRKALPEQIAAFARFRKRVPDARLFLHTMDYEAGSTQLSKVLESLELKYPAVTFSWQVAMYLGMFPEADMIRWYQAMDVVMNCSRGEGFGLPAIEAQACGTPVVLADNTTGPELRGPGWLVPCDPWWNAVHEAWWGSPSAKGMTSALVNAARIGDVARLRGSARAFAVQYDVESVWPLFEKALADMPS